MEYMFDHSGLVLFESVCPYVKLCNNLNIPKYFLTFSLKPVKNVFVAILDMFFFPCKI